MKYDALTIDTQTVMSNSFHFDGGLLGQLKQFKNGHIAVIITQIVAAEISRHLREQTLAAKVAAEAAHKKAQLFGLKQLGEPAFPQPIDSDALAKSRLEKYIDEIGAFILSPDDLPMRDLVKTYTEALPPFAKSGDKKNEFPDAIALLSLEHWAKANNKYILAVSGDSDWAAFGENSYHIDVVKKLPEALALLQEDLDQADDLVQNLLSEIDLQRSGPISTVFRELLAEAISQSSPDGDAESDYYNELEYVDATMTDFELQKDEDWYPAGIMQTGRSKIVADVELIATVDAEGTFSLEGFDSIDRESFSLGSTTARVEDEEVSIEALVTFVGDFASGDVGVSSVEIVGRLGFTFGYVEPDIGEPDYDDMGRDDEESLAREEPSGEPTAQ